jgi:hypothetical protein
LQIGVLDEGFFLLQFGEEFVAEVLLEFRGDARDESAYHELDGCGSEDCDDNATHEESDRNLYVAFGLALFAHRVELDARLRGVEQRAKAQDSCVKGMNPQVRLGWIGEVDWLAFAIGFVDLELRYWDLEDAKF